MVGRVLFFSCFVLTQGTFKGFYPSMGHSVVFKANLSSSFKVTELALKGFGPSVGQLVEV